MSTVEQILLPILPAGAAMNRPLQQLLVAVAAAHQLSDELVDHDDEDDRPVLDEALATVIGRVALLRMALDSKSKRADACVMALTDECTRLSNLIRDIAGRRMLRQ